MQNVSCVHELGEGERRVDRFQVHGGVQGVLGWGGVHNVRGGDVRGFDGGIGVREVSCGHKRCIIGGKRVLDMS